MNKQVKRRKDFFFFFLRKDILISKSGRKRSQQQTMETLDSGRWSDLPADILRSLFERLSFMDFYKAKIRWYVRTGTCVPSKR